MLALHYRFNCCLVPLSLQSMLVVARFCSNAFCFSLRRVQMASGGELGRSTGTAVVDTWSQARLQEFADKAAQEKAYLIRKRLGDQHIQVSCKYHALV